MSTEGIALVPHGAHGMFTCAVCRRPAAKHNRNQLTCTDLCSSILSNSRKKPEAQRAEYITRRVREARMAGFLL